MKTQAIVSCIMLPKALLIERHKALNAILKRRRIKNHSYTFPTEGIPYKDRNETSRSFDWKIIENNP